MTFKSEITEEKSPLLTRSESLGEDDKGKSTVCTLLFSITWKINTEDENSYSDIFTYTHCNKEIIRLCNKI